MASIHGYSMDGKKSIQDTRSIQTSKSKLLREQPIKWGPVVRGHKEGQSQKLFACQRHTEASESTAAHKEACRHGHRNRLWSPTKSPTMPRMKTERAASTNDFLTRCEQAKRQRFVASVSSFISHGFFIPSSFVAGRCMQGFQWAGAKKQAPSAICFYANEP